jgi:hypothetical protein
MSSKDKKCANMCLSVHNCTSWGLWERRVSTKCSKSQQHQTSRKAVRRCWPTYIANTRSRYDLSSYLSSIFSTRCTRNEAPVKVRLSRFRHAGDKGERRYSSYSFLTSALDGVGGQRHVPATLYLWKRTVYRSLGGPQRWSWHRG